MNKANLKRITELRHELHRRPELSMCEKRTIAVIKHFLSDNTSLELHDCGSWFYAIKRGTDITAERVAFRADMDALPISEGIELEYASECDGVSHKCGHDGHCAALCGLALELNDIQTERTIYLIFQPGEEIGEGAMHCVSLINEENISEIYAFHNLGGYEENCVIYKRGLTQPSSEGLTIRMSGKEAHASAPQNGINPAAAISELALYSLQSREFRGIVLCTIVGIHVGTGDFGISAGSGEISFTLRAENESELKRFEDELKAYSENLGRKYGLVISFEISDYFPETRNDDSCIDCVINTAENIGVRSLEMDKLWLASEDFGYYTKHCRGAMFYIGNGKEYPPLHTTGYDFNDSILETAVDMFVGLALTK